MNNTTYAVADERQRTSARASAEALFAPKPSPSIYVAEAKLPQKSERKPRVLSALITGGTKVMPVTQTKPGIPSSDVARVRTWVQYGMKLGDIAAMYSVTADDVRQALKKS